MARLCFGRPEHRDFPRAQWAVPDASFFRYVLRLAEPFAVEGPTEVMCKAGRVDTAEGFLLAVAALSLKKSGVSCVRLKIPHSPRGKDCSAEWLRTAPFLFELFGKDNVVVGSDAPRGAGVMQIRDEAAPEGWGVLARADSRRLAIPCVFDQEVGDTPTDIPRLIGMADLACYGRGGSPSRAFAWAHFAFMTRMGEEQWRDSIIGGCTDPIIAPVVSLEAGLTLSQRLPPPFSFQSTRPPEFVTVTDQGDIDVFTWEPQVGMVVVRQGQSAVQCLYDACKVTMGYNEADRLLGQGELSRLAKELPKLKVKQTTKT
jgi:hypothetical protein